MHIQQQKHAKNMHSKYYCQVCDYRCSRKFLWGQHLGTRKHKLVLTGERETRAHTILLNYYSFLTRRDFSAFAFTTPLFLPFYFSLSLYDSFVVSYRYIWLLMMSSMTAVFRIVSRILLLQRVVAFDVRLFLFLFFSPSFVLF